MTSRAQTGLALQSGRRPADFPSASTMAWILVLNPPLLRPIAWSSPSFFERRRCAGVRARWCCRSWRTRWQVTGLASGLKVASLVADIVERLPDAALDPAILSEQS